MKTKKWLAVLATVSLLASMGVSAAAEDEAVTTTVTTTEEAVTTTAAETTTVTEETTAETTTSSETETTEENAVVGSEQDAITIIDDMILTLTGTVTYEKDNSLYGNQQLVLKLDNPFYATYNYNNNDGNLNGKTELIDSVQIWADDSSQYAEGDKITVVGMVTPPLTAYYVRNVSLRNCTITKLGSTTTTDEEQEKIFTVEIPTSYVTAVCGITGEPITESNYKNSMVVSVTDITGCTNGTASIVSNGSFVAGFTVKDAKPGTITITGTTGTFSSNDGDPSINTSHGQCGAAGNPDTFTVNVTIDENGNITGTSPVTPDEPEKTFTVEIPLDYVQLYVGYNNKSPDWNGEWTLCDDQRKIRSIEVSRLNISTSNGTIADVIGGCDYCDEHSFLRSIKLKDVKPGKLHMESNVIFQSFVEEGEGYHGVTSKPDDGWKLVVDVTIDENGNIVTGDSNNGGSSNDGKTDSGSTTSNKPSNNNTAGTPKTGDVATLPAVALGLTMTAAGVVAVLYKKRK